jgi:UDP-N-acetylglucosamine--N-acetylmuramyl-(pentapeptide) pyrophosphoryl-undecaprenol N-acetylglucosamine transferase
MKKKIMIMAGGTGGHIFPGLVIAKYLKKKGWHVSWIGTKDHIESILIPKHGINIDYINVSGLRGKKILDIIISLMKILYSFFQALLIIRKRKPNIILSMGGYVSGPGGLAAILYNIPLLVHEQNRISGLTNTFLSKISTKNMQAFLGALSNAEVVGNPIRKEIECIPSPFQRFHNRTGPLRILIIGGSQGSYILNKIVPESISLLKIDLLIWHQVGKGNQKKIEEKYKNIKKNKYKIIDFIDNIANAYSWADIIICRAGALTVSEISLVGLPAIFIPYPHKDQQQYLNALPLKTIGAAIIIEENNFTAHCLANILNQYDRKTLMKMAKKAQSIAISNSIKKITKIINNII